MGIEWEGSEVDDDNPHEGLAGGPGIPVTTSFFFINKLIKIAGRSLLLQSSCVSLGLTTPTPHGISSTPSCVSHQSMHTVPVDAHAVALKKMHGHLHLHTHWT